MLCRLILTYVIVCGGAEFPREKHLDDLNLAARHIYLLQNELFINEHLRLPNGAQCTEVRAITLKVKKPFTCDIIKLEVSK